MCWRLSQGYVFEEEWVDIIKYLYNQEDALTLIVAVRDVITRCERVCIS
jgi:hypothetical protein